MNEFDIKAGTWDDDPMKLKRAEAVASGIMEIIPPQADITVLEFGAGTGLTSFILKNHVKEITMMDNSTEMVRIANEKIIASGSANLKAIQFDLEKEEWTGEKFDIILTQMVLHHIPDYMGIIRKFRDMLNPGAYIAVADLYTEDGSFHGDDFRGHKGFDIEKLSSEIRLLNFEIIHTGTCFSIRKETKDNEMKQFDLFLMIAKVLNKK